jgi:hypothetical protein
MRSWTADVPTGAGASESMVPLPTLPTAARLRSRLARGEALWVGGPPVERT